jgi:Protein of unknown function (DUF3631)/Bifunctional DNA primase/polymerase, N-terminal
MTNLDVALRYAEAGFRIFPCGIDKRPLVPSWATERTADAARITAWWKAHPDALVGLPMKPHGLLVFDADRHHDGEDGVAFFRSLCAEHEPLLPAHPIVLTANGGEHHIFRQPANKLGNRKLGNGLETRGYKDDNDGGYIIAAGSRLPDGRCWRQAKGSPSLLRAELIEPPAWLAGYASEQREEQQQTIGIIVPVVSSKREESYAAKALDNLARDLAAMAPESGRNNQLNVAALKLGGMVAKGWIGESTVTGRLFDACVANGLLKDTGAKAVNATIRSGLTAGLAQPHADLQERDKPKGNGAANASAGTDEKAIDVLAQLDTLTYQKRRLQEAKSLGIPVAALDKLVRQNQAQVEADKAELPHWKVEPWDSAVDSAGLLTDIEQVFVRYVYLPRGASVALALWTLHAWTMDAGDISPFLVLVSPTKRCGKTTVLIILYYLTPRSELASNISPSALFRYVEEIRPTLLIDEADSFVKDNEELRGILNSGHTKAAAHVIRNVEINGEHKPRRFSTWAAKAIATIRALADTLEDRAIVLMLQRKPRTAKVERLRKRDGEEFAALRQKATRWAADNFDKLADPDPQVPDVLNDRAADNWRPLLAIADLAEGEWPKRAREAACTLSGDGHEAVSDVELLRDIRTAFGDLDVITSADLVAALTADPERPWATWGRNDKPLTQNQLARLLKPFAIISETVHPLGRPHAKGYKRVHFEGVWEGYLSAQNTLSQPSSDFKACGRASADETGTTRDFQSVQKTSSHTLENANLSHSHAGLHARTFQNPESAAESDSATNGRGNDPGPIPEFLLRRLTGGNGGLPAVGLSPAPPAPLPLCDHCGTPTTNREPWPWPGRPAGIVLHSSCEGPWYDADGGRQ